MEWLNEPAAWTGDGQRISITADPKTDFWRKTHYGFVHDNGHLYAKPMTGDFTAEVKVTGAYAALYDHAGLMVRLDDTTWMKCGVELVHGQQLVGAVVTREYSDWSVSPVPNPESIWMRVTRTDAAIEISYSLDGEAYHLLRLGYLTSATVLVGVMAASPEGDGFTAVFDGLTINPTVRTNGG